MNLKPTIIALALMLFSINVFGQYNYIQKLGSLATVALPDTPKLVEKEEAKVYITKYHGVIFLAEVGEDSGGLKDLFRKNNYDSLYNSFIKGMLGEKGRLFYKNKININEQEGVEFGYKIDLNGRLTYRYNHVVSLNDTLLMCGIWSSDSLSKDDKHLAAFFNGFKIKSKKQLSSNNAAELGRKTGNVIGIIILISIPIILGLGIIFIIKRIAYGRKK